MGAVLKNFNDLLHPLARTNFFSEVCGSSFRVIPGTADKIGDVFSWAHLNFALAHHRLAYPRLRLFRNGDCLAEDTYTLRTVSKSGHLSSALDHPRLLQLLYGGTTLVLDAVHELSPALADLCESLTGVFLSDVQANAYASWGSSPGFGIHWDDHDVFAVQIAGRKHWKIYASTRPFPLYRDVEANDDPPAECLWEGVTEHGDVLYIPRGQWHEAVTLDEPSLHISIGIKAKTGVSLMEWLTDEVRANELFRKDLPVYTTEQYLIDHQTHLKKAIMDIANSDILLKYINHLKGTVSPTHKTYFPFLTTDANSAEISSKIIFRGLCHSAILFHGDYFYFNSMGKNWNFHISCLSIIQKILSGKELTVGDILSENGGAADGELTNLIRDLMVNEFIRAV